MSTNSLRLQDIMIVRDPNNWYVRKVCVEGNPDLFNKNNNTVFSLIQFLKFGILSDLFYYVCLQVLESRFVLV